MKKLSILMAAVLFGGTAVSVWSDALNPQPLPPGAAQTNKGGTKITKHKPSPGTSSFKTRRLLPKTHISTDGGKNLTLHDKNQIKGNINGGNAKNNLNKSLDKSSFIKANGTQGKSKIEITGSGTAAH